MTFRARLFLAIFFFSVLPLAYILGVGQFINPYFIGTIFALCVFVLIGAMAGAVKVDDLVKASENRAVRSEAEYQIFIERVHDGIFSVDADGKTREINTALAQALRYEPAFLKGRKLWDYLHCEKGVPDQYFVAPSQARATCVMTGKVKTGGTQDFLVDLYVQKKGSRFDGFRGCARPVAKALAQEKIRQIMAVELFRILRTKLQDRLVEIRTVVQSGQDPTAAQAALEGTVNRLLCQLAACFEESVPLSWAPKLSVQNVAPAALLEQVRARHEPVARLHGQSLRVQCFADPMPFRGDPDYLMELLGSLVDNALKYSPEKGEIELLYHETEERRSFAVWDKGIGIPQVEMSHLFTPFFRGENSANVRLPGLGLGLWTAKQIAEAHQGNLVAESELGKGSTFTFFMLKAGKDQQIKWID
jgi:nitrogen-specific signal transduction histidine kinase